MRVTLWKLILAVAVLGLIGGGAVVFGGLYNVSARKGHFPGVSAVLHTTFRNSVALRAPSPDKTPDLTDPALIALGAGHYATACATCHAAPGTARTATMRAMVPAPPPIAEAARDWTPEELWWIVFNGVKMSGMPGWPADRGDEVWSVVAWLEALNEDRAPALPGPRQDAPRNASQTDAATAYCETCHGPIPRHVPTLGLQSEAYLLKALTEYRAGTRASGIMQQAATVVPEAAFAELAAHFAGEDLPAPDPADWRDADLAAGEDLARNGDDDVPACTACHGPDATRTASGPAGFPVLAGQDRDYLRAQLKVWRDGKRGGTGRAELMTAAAQDLTDAEIDAISAWYAALPPSAMGEPETDTASEPDTGPDTDTDTDTGTDTDTDTGTGTGTGAE
ncbi:MAG: c-type cytochrome [Celeribacter sp.]|jgi:cytochrome c553